MTPSPHAKVHRKLTPNVSETAQNETTDEHKAAQPQPKSLTAETRSTRREIWQIMTNDQSKMTNRGSLSELLTSICHCSFVISHLTENPLLFAKDSCAFSWERAHPACRAFETRSTLEACAPRDDLRVSAVRLLGCFWLRLCRVVEFVVTLVGCRLSLGRGCGKIHSFFGDSGIAIRVRVYE